MPTRRAILAGMGASVAVGSGTAVGLRALAVGPKAWTPLPSGQVFELDGLKFEVECGNKPIAVSQSRAGVVRVRLTPRNGWHEDDPDQVERAEMDGWPSAIPTSEPIWTAWSMLYEDGPLSTSDWCIVRQLFQVDGEPLAYILKPGGILHWVGSDPTTPPGSWPTRHSQKIDVGRWMNFVEALRLAPAGGGYWKCWIDGKQVLDYAGPLGSRNVHQCYTKFGLYRSVGRPWDGDPNVPPQKVTETIAIRYANMRFGSRNLQHLVNEPGPLPPIEAAE